MKVILNRLNHRPWFKALLDFYGFFPIYLIKVIESTIRSQYFSPISFDCNKRFIYVCNHIYQKKNLIRTLIWYFYRKIDPIGWLITACQVRSKYVFGVISCMVINSTFTFSLNTKHILYKPHLKWFSPDFLMIALSIIIRTWNTVA